MTAIPEVYQHFVTFLSPGTFISEQTTKPIDRWDVEIAKKMALEVSERYNATPYGFYFSTRGRGPADLDSKQIASSPFYYLGGKIETREEIEARHDPKDRILLSNMESNGFARVIVNNNSWQFTAGLKDTDVVLDFTPPKRRTEDAA